MDKQLLGELLTLLDDDTRGDIIHAKVDEMERGDPSARLWLIANCIWISQREQRTDPQKAGIASGFALRLTGYEPRDLA